MYKILAICIVGFALAGCESDEKFANPEIKSVGTFQGCDVSFVDRGYLYNSFYIATCSSAVVTTGHTGGKNSTPMANVQNISGLTQEEKDLILKNRDSARQSALSKLSDEEKSVLGVK